MIRSFYPGEKAGNGAVFNDVNADDWFCGAVGWACENGFAEGAEGSFRPLEAITCQDMITFLYRWAKSAGYDVSAAASFDGFAGADSVSDYAVDALRWAAAKGLFSGIPDGTLNLTGSVTRAQAAAIMTHLVCNAL